MLVAGDDLADDDMGDGRQAGAGDASTSNPIIVRALEISSTGRSRFR